MIVDFDSTDEKLVVFCHHVHLAKELIVEANRRGKAIRTQPIAVGFMVRHPLWSGTKLSRNSKTQRQSIQPVLVTTVGAGGIGLNLQVAKLMLIVEATFMLVKCYRPKTAYTGQVAKTPCTIHYNRVRHI